MKKVLQIFFLIFVLFFFAHVPHVAASTYYVAVNGNDNNSCPNSQNIGSPKKTINSGITCLAAGDTLLVKGGIYDEVLNNPPIAGTSWANKVRIANYNNEVVWMTPVTVTNPGGSIIYFYGGQQYVEIEGINLDSSRVSEGTIRLDDTHAGHARFMNLESKNGENDYANNIMGSNFNEFINIKVHGGGRPGQLCGVQCHAYAWYVAGANNLVEGGEMYDLSGAGVHIYNGHGASDNNIIRNNRIHDVNRTGTPGQVWGILMSGNNNLVYNNLIWDIENTDLNDGTGDGIFVYYGVSNKIWNNTIYSNGNRGIFINGDASNTEVKNNILYANSGSNYLSDATSSAYDYNLETNPLFENADALDFHLKSGSLAINAGLNTSLFTKDFAGASRTGTYDIGAYEYIGTTAPQPPPSSSGTRVPPSNSVTADGVTWTLGSSSGGGANRLILQNGVNVEGIGSQILWYNNIIYVLGTDNNWYKWDGSFYYFGPNDPAAATPLKGDFNLDHIVNAVDWSYMNSKWFGNDSAADLSHDGVVNAIDFSMMNANWGKNW